MCWKSSQNQRKKERKERGAEKGVMPKDKESSFCVENRLFLKEELHQKKLIINIPK